MTGKYRDGALLELGFYFGNLPETDALATVIRALIDLGVHSTGEGVAHFGPDARAPFSFSHEWPRQPIQFELADLELVLADPDVRLTGVYMLDAGGTGQTGVAEFVGYMGISRRAMGHDRHPIGISTDGNPFDAPPDEFDAARAYQTGEQIYRRFVALARATSPAYAAILPGYLLQCPTDLRLAPSGHNFRDFFVSESYVGARNIAAIRDLYAGAYHETVDNGLYVSCTQYFNPQRAQRPDDPAQQAAVARVIGYAADQDSDE